MPTTKGEDNTVTAVTDPAHERTSGFYWLPRVPKDVPVPAHALIPLTAGELRWKDHDVINAVELAERLFRNVDIPFPWFVKTDVTACKWEFHQTCFVKDFDSLPKNMSRLLDVHFREAFRFPLRGFIVKEYVPPKTGFTAFEGDLPIAPEVRVFIGDGKMRCYHPYWEEDAIQFPSRPDWPDLLRGMTGDVINYRPIWMSFTSSLVEAFEGEWAFDFMMTASDRWILIDAADASLAEHRPNCRFL